MKILVVDDDEDFLDLVLYSLRREGFNVVAANDGRQAVRRWETDNPDLILLDVGLPCVNGIEVCRRIREKGPTPVIMMTGLGGEEHVTQGFANGADDYVTKPFNMRELAMRIRAVLRRVDGHLDREPAEKLQIGDLVLEVESHRASWRSRSSQLTPIEFRLLHLLASNAGTVVGGERMVEYGWRFGSDGGDTSLLRTHLCHIRRKLGLPREGPGSIVTLRGVGYRLVRQERVEENLQQEVGIGMRRSIAVGQSA